MEEEVTLHSLDKKLAVLIEHCESNFGYLKERVDSFNCEVNDLKDEMCKIETGLETAQVKNEIFDERWKWIKGVWVFVSSILLGIIASIINWYVGK